MSVPAISPTVIRVLSGRLKGTTVGVMSGLAMLGIAAALLLLGRPRKGEDMRPNARTDRAVA